MILHRTSIAAGTVIGSLLFLAVPTTARSQPVPRFARLDVPSLAAVARPLPFRTIRDLRSPEIEREHIRAQRVISRVCTGC